MWNSTNFVTPNWVDSVHFTSFQMVHFFGRGKMVTRQDEPLVCFFQYLGYHPGSCMGKLWKINEHDLKHSQSVHADKFTWKYHPDDCRLVALDLRGWIHHGTSISESLCRDGCGKSQWSHPGVAGGWQIPVIPGDCKLSCRTVLARTARQAHVTRRQCSTRHKHLSIGNEHMPERVSWCVMFSLVLATCKS